MRTHISSLKGKAVNELKKHFDGKPFSLSVFSWQKKASASYSSNVQQHRSYPRLFRETPTRITTIRSIFPLSKFAKEGKMIFFKIFGTTFLMLPIIHQRQSGITSPKVWIETDMFFQCLLKVLNISAIWWGTENAYSWNKKSKLLLKKNTLLYWKLYVRSLPERSPSRPWRSDETHTGRIFLPGTRTWLLLQTSNELKDWAWSWSFCQEKI